MSAEKIALGILSLLAIIVATYWVVAVVLPLAEQLLRGIFPNHALVEALIKLLLLVIVLASVRAGIAELSMGKTLTTYLSVLEPGLRVVDSIIEQLQWLMNRAGIWIFLVLGVLTATHGTIDRWRKR
ncbi:MAG: hypothetical protein A2788_01075 [Candidatus Abawacabacteria bacterium RIFCSPHIGHO2_01_FULL_46_8]|uniref:Uncharacterized protein n=1 Tax=Candidatus Abawacabacteria bacterium RIFCSPHIGHO2_01_FULL_46_8 TaxID=1817815 RepID=A0A1F4XJD9_9BACT|nr:MAG: hypothetical protein A2788_01075 [Candidatus Abawacabacteria bacterium RIFCSPHIGHO2_01_FULL_46_8]